MATMSLQAAYDQARSYLEANRVEQAIGVAQHILEHFPENLEAHRILGEAHLASRQYDQAEAAFTRVLLADPENIPAHVGLGFTYERQGKLDQAVTELEQALEVRPDMPELRSHLLRLYTDIWGAEGATLRLSRPGLARLYAKGHMLPQAIQEFRSVIEEQPGRFDARVGLAEALWRDGQEQAAVEVCEEILAERPDVLKANLLLGYIKLANSDAGGEVYWRHAQQLDPYQSVARALFETLPDLPGPDLQVPAWDEEAWAARRQREAEERLAVEAAPAAAPAAAAVAEDDDLFGASWLDAAVEQPAAPRSESGGTTGDYDDFLASLLASDTTPSLPAEEGTAFDPAAEITPFSFDELDFESAHSPAATRPVSVDEEAPAAPAAREEPALEPFSLADLGLSEEEIAELEAPAAPAAPAAREEPALEPFSLADLGLSEEEIAQLEAPAAPAAPAAREEPALEPFSLADLGLSEEEIAQLEAPAAPAASAAREEPALEPFSLADLGLSEEEIAQLEAPAAPAAHASEPELANLEPFDWDTGTSADTSATTAEDAFDLSELTPFSLDDLDLSATDENDIGTLPSSLQPFSLDESAPPPPAASLPPLEPDEAEASGGYSWQQPAAKGQTDFLRRDEPDPSKGSIFGRLRQQASTRAPQEPPPLPDVSDEEAASAGYFSNDDVSLRDDEPAGTERFASGFRLPKEKDDEGVSPAAPLAAAAAAAAAGALAAATRDESRSEPEPEPEPELKPFSLEELGLTPEEIAALQAAEHGAAPVEAAPAAPPSEPEPELTPFSLEELGLTPEEIAALNTGGELPLPATGDTIVPGWSKGEEPELTPFSFDELAASTPGEPAPHTEDASYSSVEPFSFDDLEGSPEAVELGDAGIQPFSLDDLELNDGQPASDPSRELGLTAEELAGLDLGEIETIISEPTASLAEDPDAAFERLMNLGQRQGFVDLTDIISIVSDPEAEADRIEEIGWALHRAGIQIRDGDEIIDMEESEEEVVDAAQVDAQATAPSAPSLDAEPDLTPFSLSELGLSDEEIAALGLADAPAASAAAPAPAEAPAEPELTPFSLEELGLTPEEIAALQVAEQGGTAAAPAPAEPELTPFSLEELGLTPEEIAALQAAEQGGTAATPAPAEPELTPFSLEELGLTPEEIAALQSNEQGAADTPAPAPAEAPVEPELTPFSLEELGLTPEEIAALQSNEQGAAAPAEPMAITPDESDPFDFGLADAAPVERVTKRSEPRVEEPPPPADPADIGFQPEPLDTLDDIWQTPPLEVPAAPVAAAPPPPPPPPAREQPARVVLPPLSERSAASRPPTGRSPAPAARPAPRSREDERGARREGIRTTRGRDDELYARREAAIARTASWGRSPVTRSLTDFLPTGDEALDDYLRQLAGEPDNYGLAMAIGRLSAQTGRAELMTAAYRALIRSGQSIDEITEELEGLVDLVDNQKVQRQLYRLLGDTYSKQGRFREAMAAYGYTFSR